MEQLLAHLVGDYWFQSHWMATKKVYQWLPAVIHGITYALPFLFLTQNPIKLLIISGSHILIDRLGVGKYITSLKNWDVNGYPVGTPIWLSVWLTIITDNTLHLLINYIVLK